MGYKRLLKNYMGHVEQLLGTPLVKSADASEVFSKRDLGELGAMAAELSRNAANKRLNKSPDKSHSKQASDAEPATPNYGKILALCLEEFDMSVAEAAAITQVSEKTLSAWCEGRHTSKDRDKKGRTKSTGRSKKKLNKTELTKTLTLLISAHAQQRHESL